MKASSVSFSHSHLKMGENILCCLNQNQPPSKITQVAPSAKNYSVGDENVMENCWLVIKKSISINRSRKLRTKELFRRTEHALTWLFWFSTQHSWLWRWIDDSLLWLLGKESLFSSPFWFIALLIATSIEPCWGMTVAAMFVGRKTLKFHSMGHSNPYALTT